MRGINEGILKMFPFSKEKEFLGGIDTLFPIFAESSEARVKMRESLMECARFWIENKASLVARMRLDIASRAYSARFYHSKNKIHLQSNLENALSRFRFLAESANEAQKMRLREAYRGILDIQSRVRALKEWNPDYDEFSHDEYRDFIYKP